MVGHPHELQVPADASSDSAASEVLRAWIVKGGLHVSLKRGFDSPSMWGLLLVDLARHASRIYATENVCTESDALDAIKSMFDAEWVRPTDFGTTHAEQ